MWNESMYLMWSDPVPKLSSPHKDKRPASIKFPKNFQPVGTSKNSLPEAAATLKKGNKIKIPFPKKVGPPSE